MTSTAGRELHLTIGSRFENIELVQAVVDDALREGGAAEDARHWIGLALREAVANAIKHGNRQDPDKQVEIQASFDPEQVEIRVDDQGAGFDPDEVVDPGAGAGSARRVHGQLGRERTPGRRVRPDRRDETAAAQAAGSGHQHPQRPIGGVES